MAFKSPRQRKAAMAKMKRFSPTKFYPKGTRIEKITGVEVVRFHGFGGDPPHTSVYVNWKDQTGKTGTTYGRPGDTHIEALRARAKREGVKEEER